MARATNISRICCPAFCITRPRRTDPVARDAPHYKKRWRTQVGAANLHSLPFLCSLQRLRPQKLVRTIPAGFRRATDRLINNISNAANRAPFHSFFVRPMRKHPHSVVVYPLVLRPMWFGRRPSRILEPAKSSLRCARRRSARAHLICESDATASVRKA